MVSAETITITFTGLSISLAAFYYINTLRNSQRNQQLQLETRQAQIFSQFIDKAVSREQLEFFKIRQRAKWSSCEEWLELYENDEEYRIAFSHLAMLYDALGVYLKEGLFDIRLLALYDPQAGVKRNWEKYKDMIIYRRKKYNNRRIYDNWEYLYNTLKKYLEEHPELKT
jgi:hypothetical protein